MHGPEHHVMVGAALLTAYHNAGERWSFGRLCRRCTAAEKRFPEEPVVFGEPAEQDQYGDVSVDCYKIHSSGRKRMGTVQSDDSKGASKDW